MQPVPFSRVKVSRRRGRLNRGTREKNIDSPMPLEDVCKRVADLVLLAYVTDAHIRATALLADLLHYAACFLRIAFHYNRHRSCGGKRSCRSRADPPSGSCDHRNSMPQPPRVCWIHRRYRSTYTVSCTYCWCGRPPGLRRVSRLAICGICTSMLAWTPAPLAY